MTTRRRPWYRGLSFGWTPGRGPWVQESRRGRGNRISSWFGGRVYLRRDKNRR